MWIFLTVNEEQLWIACLLAWGMLDTLDDTEAEDQQYYCLHLSYKYWYWTKLSVFMPSFHPQWPCLIMTEWSWEEASSDARYKGDYIYGFL